MIPQSRKDLAGFIDHTLLTSTAVEADIRKLCQEARKYQFAAVCVTPKWISLAADLLGGSGVKVDGVAGFPFGTDSPRIKALDAEEVVRAGADEVDMVADLAAIIEQDEKTLARDLEAVLKICRGFKPKVLLKVIIESAALTDEQIVFACCVGQAVGVDYLKTSTGLHMAGGATVEHVRLMARTAGRCKIKAAGGIRTAAQALAMIEAGASRIGASASVDIIESFQSVAG